MNKGEISDGYHTFNELYEHRHLLFLTILAAYPEEAWISKLHEDGTMFDGGWFIAAWHPPAGQISYHLPIRLWPVAIKTGAIVLERGRKWDGHTPSDALQRIQMSLLAPG